MAQLIDLGDNGSRMVRNFGLVGNRLMVTVHGHTFGKGKPDVEYIYQKLGKNAFEAMAAADSPGSYYCKNIAQKHKADVVSREIV